MMTENAQNNEVFVDIPQEYSRLFDNDWRIAVIEGGRYSLKSHTVARCLLLLARYAKKRIVCLRQFQTNIEDSSYQLLVDLIGQYGFTDYEITKTSIVNKQTGSNFIFKGLDRNVETTIKAIEGADIAWVDEAQTITERSIRILEPTIRKSGSKIIFTLNRLTDLDPVIRQYITDPPRKNVWHLRVDYRIAQKLGWLSDEINESIEFARIHQPEVYAHDYLGQALNQTDRNIITARQVMAAMHREVPAVGAIEVGVDVARFGNDRIVFVKRKGLSEIGRVTFTKLRTTEVCDQLEKFVDSNRDVLIKIDDTGVGGGVTDEMVKRGYKVAAINFGSKANAPDKYPNIISEAWFHLASIIDEIHLTEDKDLLTELSSRQWLMDNHGRRAVESKEAYKRRGFRSPDEADATILAFYDAGIVIDNSAIDIAGSYSPEVTDDDNWDFDDED